MLILQWKFCTQITEHYWQSFDFFTLIVIAIKEETLRICKIYIIFGEKSRLSLYLCSNFFILTCWESFYVHHCFTDLKSENEQVVFCDMYVFSIAVHETPWEQLVYFVNHWPHTQFFAELTGKWTELATKLSTIWS